MGQSHLGEPQLLNRTYSSRMSKFFGLISLLRVGVLPPAVSVGCVGVKSDPGEEIGEVESVVNDGDGVEEDSTLCGGFSCRSVFSVLAGSVSATMLVDISDAAGILAKNDGASYWTACRSGGNEWNRGTGGDPFSRYSIPRLSGTAECGDGIKMFVDLSSYWFASPLGVKLLGILAGSSGAMAEFQLLLRKYDGCTSLVASPLSCTLRFDAPIPGGWGRKE